ncbi:Kelch domain-containing protein 8A [Chelonia mydas]|uniref:Kelch domain-containing protein 8A n=1 Tax=Chelonia mydas TaxID=8469 RepID=M7B5P7_CHEMY|nr:Kelch domain-containing protein 8A [Chelonia mydas]
MAQVTVGVLIEKQEQENRDQDTTDEISIKLLSDNELQEKLLMYGAEPGPILPSTRTLYENKLWQLVNPSPQGLCAKPKESGDLDRDSESEEEKETGTEVVLETKDFKVTAACATGYCKAADTMGDSVGKDDGQGETWFPDPRSPIGMSPAKRRSVRESDQSTQNIVEKSKVEKEKPKAAALEREEVSNIWWKLSNSKLFWGHRYLAESFLPQLNLTVLGNSDVTNSHVNVMQFILPGKDLAPRELLWQMWNCRINGDVMKDYRVYAAGGMGLDLRPHNYMQHYDVLKDIWVSLATMPTPRYAATSFLRGTKIYVLGGRQSKYAINAFEVFDTETRSWTKFPSIPSKRAFSSFVPTENSLFSLGGLRQGRLYRQPKFMKTVDVFDIEQGGWMKMERSSFLKKRRADFVAGYLKGRVIVAGGLGNQPTVLESAEAFHPGKNKWESLPPMPTPRCTCSSIVVKNCLLAVGGVNQGLSDAVEALCISDS